MSATSVWPALPRVKIIDVGAMWLGADTETYSRLLRALPCEVIGFEPIEKECRKLQAMNRAGHTYLPYFVGDGSVGTFHETAAPYCSSLLEPNMPMVEAFQSLAEYQSVVATREAATTRLDDIPETQGADFIKLDVQGGELMVLSGAKDRLRTALVVQTEVEFLPLYKDQPLYGDIDQFLREQGFLLHKFESGAGRVFAAMQAPPGMEPVPSQFLWADAIFVRDFLTFETMEADALYKLALILHENHASFDLAARALETYDRKTGAALRSAYLAFLASGAEQPPWRSAED